MKLSTTIKLIQIIWANLKKYKNGQLAPIPKGNTMAATAHKTIYLKDYTVPPYLIENVFLDVQLMEEHCLVTAKTTLYKNPQSDTNAKDLFLHGEDLELLSIDMEGEPLDKGCYQLSDKGLLLLQPIERFELTITTRIYPDKNTALEGLYRSSGNYCTQCEAEGFRKITYYLDRPDVMARFTTRIEGDYKSCPVLLSNGNKIEEGKLPNARHYAIWEDPFPKPSYLFALVAGDLVCIEDRFTTKSGRDIALHIFVEERNRTKCDHAMASLKKSMQWDEEVYGLEYDLDTYMIVAVDDFNMGAMENKGLNIFNSKYVLASPTTATDQDYLGVEGVIAHEYFHNWTGNRVTCRDWFQLSLKEGLTVFRDQEFSSDMNSRAVQRIDDVNILRNFQFREDAGPMAHPVRPESYVEINNFYTVTVYNKGAEVIRMMYGLLGKENFRKGMDLYFQRHDGQAVTCDDFVAAMADGSAINLDQFKRWYRQAGTPVISVEEQWDEENEEYVLHLSQKANGLPFHIPIALGLLDSKGNDIDIDDSLVELRQTQESFRFTGIKEKPSLSLLRGFSAPVKISAWQSREQLAFLMAHDSDPFNRWDASFRLSESVLLELTCAFQQHAATRLDPLYVEAVSQNLQDKKSDKSLLAMALSLPEESYLAQQMEKVDPDALHLARDFVRSELARECREDLLLALQENNMEQSHSLDPEAVGRRRLKNECLSLLFAAEQPQEQERGFARQQYGQGTNMTDVIAALSVFVESSLEEREKLLDDFYTKWKEEPLVVDKWLLLQAKSSHVKTLRVVKGLMQHPAFSINNPNKVRSLVGAFGGNHFAFHEKEGSGYVFLADQILVLDSINPQIASRLLTPFIAWKRYDEGRRQKMRAQLTRIVEKEGVSGDVYEIVNKCLS